MNKSKILDCERSRIEKMIKFQLPNKYIKIGIGIFLATFLSFIVLKIMGLNSEFTKLILRSIMLVSLLVISVSKDKEEDEMVKLIRVQSYALAFVIGVLFAVIQPVINYLVSFVVNTDKTIYSNLGDFQVLIFMLMIQL
ncbi:MAG: hypothetical protein KAH72_09540, partial [Flavobacteriaceae bacterium]|nr:hypothetical protein [Flavobacteriaceae bacterium]